MFFMFCLEGQNWLHRQWDSEKKGGNQKRDGLQIRTIPETQRGVFYTKSTLTEQSGVLRQRERTRCQRRLKRKVLAGEELCIVTAPDKHRYAERLKVSVNKMGELKLKNQVKAVQLNPYTCTCTSYMLAYTRESIHKWAYNAAILQSHEVVRVPALAHSLISR